jgi:beta-phosphoglucomutase family hydrolase
VTATLIVAPAHRTAAASQLARSAGWEVDVDPGEGDLPFALAAGADGRSVLFVPDGARVPRRLRLILVLHEGSPAAAAGVDAADRAALATGAEIVVLHVPTLEPAGGPGGFAAPRVIDQPHYEWLEWQEEFMRRFGHCSKDISLRFELAVGSPADAALERARRFRADLLVVTWKGEAGPSRAETLKTVAAAAPCPLLILPERRRPAASLPLSRIDAVIFDMDGVVTDTASTHAAAWTRLFDGYLGERAGGKGEPLSPFTPDDYRRFVDGKPRYDGVRDFLASRDIALPEGDPTDPPDRETVCGLGNRKDEYFLAQLREHGAQAYPGTVALVRQLAARGVGTAIISASRNLTEVLDSAGVGDLFRVEVDGLAAERLGLPGKPDPAVFLEAAKRLGVEAARVAIVEDALAGVEAGRRGGFAFVVGVDRTGHADALDSAGADVVVSDLGELELEGNLTC